MLRFEGDFPGLRWVRPEGIHLTLRFLGEAEDPILEAMNPLLERAAGRCPAFDAPLLELSLLPNQARPRVLSLAIDLPEEGRTLQCACEQAARDVGFPAETRRFHPHLTLGRFRRPARGPSLPKADWGGAHFSEMVLLESRAEPGGSRYSPLRSFPLGRR
jgi:2'-5' RNA ligase